MRFRVIVVSLGLVALAACGGSGAKQNAGQTPGGTTPPTTASPSSSATPGGTRSPTVVPTSPKATPDKNAKPTPKATFSNGATATLSRTCVRRGVDQQMIVIKTSKGGPAGYNTVYSDGSYYGDGHSTYSSGHAAGFDGKSFGSPDFDDEDATENGSFQSSWKVPPAAPTGLATVRVNSAYGNVDLTFKIVSQTGHC